MEQEQKVERPPCRGSVGGGASVQCRNAIALTVTDVMLAAFDECNSNAAMAAAWNAMADPLGFVHCGVDNV